ncbi:hypothetical protein GQ602_001087 [Ophiocordyceps camponoti-floridani]|uniref:Uncharacterized protein n=1 Tax=Ophiocordyceps camponoti-floridani TaxID=2030778 RepID=A0A8H4QDC4_9HYPO|nr:hypothetical protein GQ602_001087 [Ophiocordyceps camponoti-floridani]
MLPLLLILSLLSSPASSTNHAPTYTCQGGLANNGPLFGRITHGAAVTTILLANTTAAQASGFPRRLVGPEDRVVRTGRKGCEGPLWEIPVLADGRVFNVRGKGGRRGP